MTFDITAYPHETVACNQCGGTDHSWVAQWDRYGLAVTTVQCEACKLRFINPRMTAEGYAEFYQKHYRPLVKSVNRAPHDAALAAVHRQMYVDLILKHAGALPPSARLLDLGGSTGMVARGFKARYGCTCTVVDPAPQELEEAKDVGTTICASAEDVTFPAESFDAIVICRTIEHLRDPKGVLQRARTWAAPGAVLVVDAMDASRWNVNHRYKVDHPYAFTAATFRRMVTSAGWNITGSWLRRNGQYIGLVCRPEES